MKKLLLIATLFICTNCLIQAQNVTGKWYGVGKVELANGASNAYMSELIMEQRGKAITGFLNYYFRDSLFSNKISGSFDAASRTLILNSTQIIFHKSVNTETGVDCNMSGRFILRIAKAESVLTGIMFANKSFRYTCPDINFKLKKENYKEELDATIPITKNEAEEKEATASLITIPEKTTIATTPEVIDIPKKEAFEKRAKTYTKEFEITNKEIRLEFYDNGAVDGDSISVFWNNKLILPSARLETSAIVLNIQYDESLPYNELSMFAESLGSIPPNTAVLVIYDGKRRYEILMSSDFNKTSTIKFYKQKIL